MDYYADLSTTCCAEIKHWNRRLFNQLHSGIQRLRFQDFAQTHNDTFTAGFSTINLKHEFDTRLRRGKALQK